ncbi:cell division protein ZapA [Roseivirga sp. BDSF3-8]|uniref:cell division protein ZapA n=1 Tax=Roseivirga sp. BDSF3-8 TaxID=3241598 RepID=UPI0035326699
MSDLSIKIKICDREYPMRVSAEKEEKVRQAGKALHEKIKHYRERFGIDDKQDLLAMVAFDCLVEKLECESGQTGDVDFLLRKLNQLNGLASKALP